jgi:hypothetical protein
LLPDENGRQTHLPCSECPYSDEQKPRVHCAWLPRSEWNDYYEGPPAIGSPEPGEGAPWGPDVGVCPGAALEHPFVRDVVHARVAMDGGCLTTFVSRPTHALLDGILILKSAFNIYERQQLRKGRNTGPPAGSVVGPPPK